MKQLILTGAALCLFISINAQNRKIPIYKISGKPANKMLKLKTERKITIRTLLIESDSLKLSETYSGSIIGISGDSMKITLTDYIEFRNYKNGLNKQVKIPGNLFLKNTSLDTGKLNIRFSAIHYLRYTPGRNEKLSGIAEGAVFISLAGVIFSPLICYDYKQGKFNAERYKYWGLISSISLTASLCVEIFANRYKEYQFKRDWPQKKKKVWSFTKSI